MARVTINHQEIVRMMRDIQVSLDRHPIRMPIHTDPTNVFNGPVILGNANGAQLTWNNQTAFQQHTGDEPAQIAAGFEAIARQTPGTSR